MKKITILSIATILIFGSASGCKFLEYFKSSKKQVKRQVERIKAGVNNSNWVLIDSIMTKDFTWTTSDGITYKNQKRKKKTIEFGKKFFKESVQNLPRNRMAFYMDVTDIEKITKTRYLATINSRLQIRLGPGDTDNIKWTSNQTWVKQGDRWLLTALKDTSEKMGNRNVTYTTNPPPPKKRPSKKRKRRRSK